MTLYRRLLHDRERVATLLERSLHRGALLVLGLVVVGSVTRPYIPFDSWMYHLPFSALLWNIGDARETFVLSSKFAELYAGYPLLAELVQGGLWWASGTLATVPLLNSLALVLFICAATRATTTSLPVLTFAILSVPLVAIHSVSTYIDLFAGVLICFQILAGSLLVDRPSPASARQGGFAFPAALYIVATAAAGNTKYNVLIASMAISTFLLAYVSLQRGGSSTSSRT
jgi:hypothetical protein